MSSPDPIIRIAARGDGVTASGKHVPGSAPGDVLLADGTLEKGPHHSAPACRHFGTCGGCQLQHLDEAALTQFVSDRVMNAAEGKSLKPQRVAAPYLSPPASRRRASLHAGRICGRIAMGFRENASHRIVDMTECPVLVPELADLVPALRKLLARQDGRIAVDIELTLVEQGVDVAIKGLTVEGLKATEAMLDFARDHALARLMLDQGYGYEALWEPEPVTIALSGISVPFPPGSFLQATADGEAALLAAAREWLADSPTVADLFSGLGTFAFALAPKAKVLAAEASRDASFACKTAAGAARQPIFTMHRDLYRNPLMSEELNRFAAVLLDPPRAGAQDVVTQIVGSTVPRVVYISCNPSTWARDAVVLVDAGYRLEQLRAVGQFRWSTHVELASLFVKKNTGEV